MRNTLVLPLFCLLALFSAVHAEKIDPSDPAIRYAGRFSDDYRFGWTGSMIETQFDGSTISADLDLYEGKVTGMAVVIDGEQHFLEIKAGRHTYTLAEDLEPGVPHTIGLFKRTEPYMGSVRFYGFEISEDGKLSPVPPPERKMLVVGDSITCGYGNEATDVKEGNTVTNENGYMSYAAIAARELNADLTMICWSGHGLFRNRSLENDRKNVMPVLFEQTLPTDASLQWDHGSYIPDVVVINLGTNDLATRDDKKAPLDKDDYCQAYVAFLKRIREVAPDSKLFLSIGPMVIEPVASWLPEVAAQFDAAYVVVFSKFDGPVDIGGHYHPSVIKDQKMADELTAAIREHTEW